MSRLAAGAAAALIWIAAAGAGTIDNLKSFNDALKDIPPGAASSAFGNPFAGSAVSHMGKDALTLDNLKKATSKPAPDAKTAKEIFDGINKFGEAYKNLSESDNKYNPELDQPDAPSVPTHCEGNNKCGACYADAQYELNKQRFNLERLRIIVRHTHDLAAAGIALLSAGGAAGGSVAALEASQQIMETQKALAKFDAQAKVKREELMGKLKGSLTKIGECEAQFFNTPDWYDRFGFIYYQFMEFKYSG